LSKKFDSNDWQGVVKRRDWRDSLIDPLIHLTPWCPANPMNQYMSHCGKGVFNTPLTSSFKPTSELSCLNL